MKIRSGFVSNSSSASFIINWRMRTFGKEVDKQEAVLRLLDCGIMNSKGNMEIDKTFFDENYQKMVEEIIKSTEQNKDGTFTTDFFTSMLNNYDNLGEGARSMSLALICNTGFQLIDAKLEGDDY